MKFFISTDIEGVTGVTDWRETEIDYPEYEWAREQMTREVIAACEGLNELGAEEIWVKDAHFTARNMDIDRFPDNVRVIRGWAEEPGSMMTGLDESFDGVLFIGYHNASYTDDNPLSHSFSSGEILKITLNGKLASEFTLNARIADYYKVPIIFLSGDLGICQEAKGHSKSIETVAVKYGLGGATFNIHPQKAVEEIKEGVKRGYKNISNYNVKPDDKLELEIVFKEHTKARRGSFFPDVQAIDSHSIRYIGEDIVDIMTALMFLV